MDEVMGEVKRELNDTRLIYKFYADDLFIIVDEDKTLKTI